MTYSKRRRPHRWLRKPNPAWTEHQKMCAIADELGGPYGEWLAYDSGDRRMRLKHGSTKYFCEKYSISRTTLWRISRRLTKAARLAFGGKHGWFHIFEVERIAPRLPKHLWRKASEAFSNIVSHADHLPLLKSLLSGALDLYAMPVRAREANKQILASLGVQDPENWVQLSAAIKRCKLS